MVGNEQNEGLSTVHDKTEKFEIPFMLIRPFGPFIVKSRLPQELIDDYNEELEKIIKDKNLVKEFDWSPQLVGKVKHELRVPENVRKNMTDTLRLWWTLMLSKLLKTRKDGLLNFRQLGL